MNTHRDHDTTANHTADEHVDINHTEDTEVIEVTEGGQSSRTQRPSLRPAKAAQPARDARPSQRPAKPTRAPRAPKAPRPVRAATASHLTGSSITQRVIVNVLVVLAGLALVGWSDANRGWAIPDEPKNAVRGKQHTGTHQGDRPHYKANRNYARR